MPKSTLLQQMCNWKVRNKSNYYILYSIRTTWAHIAVGDLVLVEENESFPADLIILGSSIPSGVCYIETSSLDGEKNLKPKSALMDT